MKRILSLLLSLMLIVSMVPISIAADSSTPSVQALIDSTENVNQSDGIVFRKSAAPLEDGSVNVVIEAYTTGTVRQTTANVPTDIVLVLDTSGSMDDDETATTVSKTLHTESNGSSWSQRVNGRRVTYYGFQDTTRVYYVNVGTAGAPVYVPVTHVQADANYCHYYSYFDNNGNTVYVYPELRNNLNVTREHTNYPVVQFYAETVSTTTIDAIDALKDAVEEFIYVTQQKNAEIMAQGGSELHRIALVKFGSAEYYNDNNLLAVGNNTFNWGYNYTQLVANLTAVDAAGAQALTTSVNSLTPGGATAVDYGMNIAEEVLTQTPNGRNKVVIVFSDGSPTHSSSFSNSVANDAIEIANSIKFSGAKVYSISVAPDANPADTSSSNNRFFHYLSSNYPNATSMNAAGNNGDSGAGYYMTPSTSESLTMLFVSIAQSIESPTIELGASAQIVDTMSLYFSMPDGADNVTLETADRTYDAATDTYDWTTPVSAANLTPVVSGKTVSVQGFNYDENYVSDVARTKGSNSNYYGTKLIITINLQPDYEMIDTHAELLANGYIPTNNGTANILNANGSSVASVTTPYAPANTVTYRYTAPGASAPTVYAAYYRFPGSTQTKLTTSQLFTGYTFSGWSVETPASLTVAADGSYTMPDNDVVFAGNYVKNQYTVTYKITGYNPNPTELKAPASFTAGYGDTVNIAADLSYAGYTFTGWKADLPVIDVNDTKFTMPDHEVTLYGYFTPKENVPYKVIHYTQNLDGTTYAKYAEESFGGTVDQTVTAEAKAIPGFTFDSTVQDAVVSGASGTYDTRVSGTVAADGSLTLHLFYTRNQYTVTYAYQGSVPSDAPAVPVDANKYYHGQTVTILGHSAQDAFADHDFAGWHSTAAGIGDTDTSFVMPIGGMTLYGEFTIDEHVGFTVEHYFQLPDGNYPTAPDETDSFTGVAKTTVYAADYQLSRTGYKYVQDDAYGIISEASPLVLKLYYALNHHKVTYQYEGTVPAGATDVSVAPYQQTNVAYGTSVAVALDATAPGYTFSGWRVLTPVEAIINPDSNTFVMPDGDVILVGYFAADVDTTYKVEYYWQNIQDDGYSLHETDVYHTGVTGQTLDVLTTHTNLQKNYTGLTFNENASGAVLSGVVSGDPDNPLVLKLYYDRNTYTVSYAYEDASVVKPSQYLTAPAEYRFGATVTIAPDAEAEHYSFNGWYGAAGNVTVTQSMHTFQMPAADMTLKGIFREITGVTYTVKHYLQNAVGSAEYTCVDAETEVHTNGIAGETAVAVPLASFTGYVYNTTKSNAEGIITADNKLVLNLYYDLVSYRVTYHIDGENPGFDLTGYDHTAIYKEQVTVKADPVVNEYIFSGWTSADPAVGANDTVFTMPSHDVVLVGSFIKYPAYDVEYYLQNADHSGYTLDTKHSHSHSAPPNTVVDAHIIIHEGYTFNPAISTITGTVSQTEKLVLKVYYDLNDYKLTYRYEGTVPANAPVYAAEVKHFGATVTAQTPSVVGYTFVGWTSQQLVETVVPGTTFTMPAKDVELVGHFVAQNAGYSVEHYLMNDYGNYNDVVPHIASMTGIVGENVRVTTYKPYLDLGATVDMDATSAAGMWAGTVTADGSLVLKIYYSREPAMRVEYHYAGTDEQVKDWPALPVDTNVYYVGSSTVALRPADSTNPDLVFEGWYAAEPSMHVLPDGTFTLPRLVGNETVLHLYGRWVEKTPDVYTVTYYVNNILYLQQTCEEKSVHTILDALQLPGQIFSGWSTPKTESGTAVEVFTNDAGKTAFVMPSANVVIRATCIPIPKIDGAITIQKTVISPKGFASDNTYTFNIYTLENGLKTLVSKEEITVDAVTGIGFLELQNLEIGEYYVVEEEGAAVAGYSLETVMYDEQGNVLSNGQPVRAAADYDPTKITIVNTYTEIPLETEEHFAYIIGYPDDTVRPKGDITRAEVATIFFRLLTDEKREEYWSQSNSFTDVYEDDWFNNAISTLENAGVLTGYEDNSFRPNNKITRAELVKIAMSFYTLPQVNDDAYPDTQGHWAAAFINAATELGFINGYEDGTFHPDQAVTRAEAMKIINRTLGRLPEKDHLLDDMITWVDNADTSAWYYADVQEATNSHTYIAGKAYEIWDALLPVRNWADLEKTWSDAHSGKED